MEAIKEELQTLREFSEICENKQKEFMSNKKLLNKKTGETEDLDYSLQKEYKLRYNDLIFKSIYFQKEMEEKYQDNFTALFITLTANTQYHKYKLDNNNLINNPKYKGYTINQSYELLNNVKRNFIKEFSKNDFGRKKITCRYLQVVEKHSSLTPHLHIVLFIQNEDLESAINIIKKKMFCTDEKRLIIDDEAKPVNKYIINSDYSKNKNNDIGRCEIEILQDSKKVTGYVSKYIKKQFQSDDINYIHELDGWKRKNRIKLVLTSKTPVPKYIYKKIASNLKENDKIKFEDLFCDIQNGTILIKTDIKTGQTKTKEAKKKEVLKAKTFTSMEEISNKTVMSEIETIKKLSERELKQILTKQEININLKIFDLFISNTNIKTLKKIKLNLMLDNFLVKNGNLYNEPVFIDDKLSQNYLKWLNKLLKHIENTKTTIKITKIERLIIEYLGDVIYDSDDWELLDYSNENKQVA